MSPLSASHARRSALVVCGVALLTLLAASALPRFSLFSHQESGELLVLHLLLEMFSVVVSVLVVVMAWHAFSREQRQASHALIYGFSVVAGVDLLHAVSYPGMPDLFSPAGTDKAIFFWFMGRSFELLAVWLVALRWQLPGRQWQWQIAALGTTAVLFVVGTWRLDWFPLTFIPGQGVTPFKAAVEWVLCGGNLLAAGYFWLAARRPGGGPRDYYFAAACFVMGLGELTFTSYLAVSDFLVIFGHLFKVASYALIYAGVFALGLRDPYVRLQRSEAALRSHQAQLDAVLSHVPAGVARLDRQGRYLYVNHRLAQRLGRSADEILGRPFEEIVASERRAEVSYHWALALAGQSSAYEGQTYVIDGKPNHASAWMAPERDAQGNVVGVIAVVLDTTEQRLLQQQLMESLHEVEDLKSALDAHAIVAITDVRGQIVSVNDKFCQISKYSREELIGQTHRIINSGHHPHSFFQELWRTISAGGIWTGEICNRAKDGELYWVNTTIVPYMGSDGRPQRYVAIRADITERKRYELKVQELAYHDALTGLPNRLLLMDRLQQLLASVTRSGRLGALLYMDLDHFKEVNDTLGHEQGDDLLRQVGQRLRASVRETDTVARLGGDEFVVLLTDLGGDEVAATTQAGLLGEELLHTLSQPYQLTGGLINNTPSIGVVMIRGTTQNTDELLKQADIALYQAKDSGRATLCFFDPAIQAAFERRMALEADLRQALAQGEFHLHYQPVVDEAHRVVMVEALLRWQHPSRGMVSPAEFIPLAEKTGLIVPVGMWVIEQACAQLQQWQIHRVKSSWQIAVNVSARQFRQDDFVAQVVGLMERYQVGAGHLKLELTESSLQDNLQETVRKMRDLRMQGVRFAIDDFGTGYSSLSYLKELPIHVLKIDRAFVQNIASSSEDAAIARAILTLAWSLGLDVVAEGVETEAQFSALRSFGCPLFQGYFFSRPVPEPELQDALRPQLAV